MSIENKLTTVAENQEKVFDAGKNSERENFWYHFTMGGTRRVYNYAFGTRGGNNAYWGDIFYPKYDMKPTQADDMFANFRCSDSSKQIDLESRLNEMGVVLDFSKCSNFTTAFSYCTGIETLPVIDMSNASGTNTNYVFDSSTIKTIRKIILGTKSKSQYLFLRANGLENVEFEGEILSSMNFNSANNLTHDSLMNIINALKDYSEDTSGTVYTITLGSTNKAKLTDDELNMITNKGWTYA